MHALFVVLLLSCSTQEGGVEICGDGYDNDGDGAADCADDDCIGVEFDSDGDGNPDHCDEVCGDGLDNDGDSLIDCDDPVCDGSGCPEACTDGRDNDKDGLWDCDDDDCIDACDVDGDGYLNGDFGGDDCDDENAAVYPDADEVCDGVDNDCDGAVDKDDNDLDRDTLTDFFLDIDGDGYGQTNEVEQECLKPADRVELSGDCNDRDTSVHPASSEICDGLDNDCDGLTDDFDPDVNVNTAATWWLDGDGDGFGAGDGVESCSPLTGYALNGDDCDDGDPTIGSSGMWLVDSDGDGFGAGAAIGPSGCTPPQGDAVSQSLPADCNDADVDVFPGSCDVCGDGEDSDCDGQDCTTWDEGFEQGLTWPWNSGGNEAWNTTTGTPHSGARTAGNGDIDDNQSSFMEMVITVSGCGQVRFWHSGDTEGSFDFLRFRIDGAQQASWSGTWGWTQATYNLAAGTHVLRWEYTKDGSVTRGYDTVWVDDIRIEGLEPL